MGAQWLSGRVLDSRPSHRFEPHWCHCVVVLEQDIYLSLVLVQPMKARPYINERFLMGRKESNKKKNVFAGSDNFGSNPLYFTFCIKTLPDMSSADNLCKRFGPRSGTTFCSGLIGVQTVCKDYQQMTM